MDAASSGQQAGLHSTVDRSSGLGLHEVPIHTVVYEVPIRMAVGEDLHRTVVPACIAALGSTVVVDAFRAVRNSW
jgi:hypothetical protein